MWLVIKIFNLLPSAIRKRLYVGIGLVWRAMTLGVRILVRDEQGRILLVRHTYVSGWYLPGGGVERGETIQQAAQKELMEECGVEADEPPALFHLYRNPSTSRFDHVALFVCSKWHQSHVKTPDHEIAEIGFFDYDDLPEGTTRQTKDRLAEILRDQPISDIW
ncbi:MAG: NUDIX domain-containing protein [Rhizobiaceae bacterium]|nr:NUDIX domain-containing protein [Rhizobiaceae bacterium]